MSPLSVRVVENPPVLLIFEIIEVEIPDFAIVIPIILLKLDPIDDILYVTADPLVTVNVPGTLEFAESNIILIDAVGAGQAVTSNGTVAETKESPFSTTEADAVLPATLPSTVAFSLYAATTILPPLSVPEASLQLPLPVSCN